MLGGEAVEGQQGVAVLGQALDSPGVLGAVLLLEDIEGPLRRLEAIQISRRSRLTAGWMDFATLLRTLPVL